MKHSHYYKSLSIIALILLGLIVYSNTFNNSFHFDDELSITNNSAIRNIQNLRNIWNFWPTRFITFFSFALNYHFHGLRTSGYYIANLLVHITASIGVYWLILLTLSSTYFKKDKLREYSGLIALSGALIFLSHPIQTASVNYTHQRAASLMALFYILSICFYARSRLQLNDNKDWKASYVVSWIFALLSVFTKENSATLPFAMLLYEYCFFKDDKPLKKGRVLPFFALLPVMLALLFLTKPVPFAISSTEIMKSPVSGYYYFLTQLRVLVTYIKLFFLPINQNLDYDYAISKTFLDPAVIMSLVFLAAIMVTAIRVFNKYRLISFGIFWFFLTLAPESSFIPQNGEMIFEHRLYLPMVGYSILLASGLYYLFKEKRAKLIVIILSLIVACYSIMTYARNFVWKDEFTLWNDTVYKSPNKARPYNNRGNAYKTKGNIDQAISDYNKAMEVDPNLVEAYNNRGNAYQTKGNLDQAILDYNKAIEIKPNYADAYNNRGNAYQAKGNLDQAILDCSRAIEIKPNLAKAYNNRGNAYQTKGNLDQAISDYNKAIEIDPNLVEACYNRGTAYQNKGSFDQAILDYSSVIKIKPDYADVYYNRGLGYQNKGNIDQAVLDYNKAIEININYADAYYNRGMAYQDKGNLDQAILDYNKAIEIKPDYADVYCNRGLAYQTKGNFDQALSDYNKAIEIDPDYAGTYINRGLGYQTKGDFDQALSDYNKAIELDPDYAGAYVNRSAVYFEKQEYAKSREDVNKAQILGYKVDPGFIEQLKKASGREE
jgi:protein O-mannosyl-transferase